ncbi:hypothetical protein PG911_04145 [Tenacibaculum ovolyticum]|uniref:hypothetical protein n=1 Tax=Tenacibaculum ovolyticum TaxID=104270 RepID=UPI0022F3F5C7|nr:hypothetical protein [Tenacibaculum ovolyticum]WBX77465.1 hypothetical protein PG911_04145 [Tenacibaculum ovolyticum]
MKKKKLITLGLLAFIISCKGIKNDKNQSFEIIQSNVMKNLYLIKNIQKRDSLLKKELMNFLIRNPPTKENRKTVSFYKYTVYNDALDMHNGTSHFIDNLPDPGGFSSEELSDYREDEIASFTISECENDTTKLVGRFYFYNNIGIRETDTLLYKCK